MIVAVSDTEDGIAPPILDTPLDYTYAEYLRYYRVVGGGVSYAYAAYYYAIGFFGLLFGGIKTALGGDMGFAFLFFSLSLFIAYCAAQPLIMPRRWVKQNRKGRLVIGEEGVRFVGDNAEAAYNWAHFAIGWEDAQMFYLSDGTVRAFLIPRRLLNGGSEQENALHALLVRRVPEWIDLRTSQPSRLQARLQQIAKSRARKTG